MDLPVNIGHDLPWMHAVKICNHFRKNVGQHNPVPQEILGVFVGRIVLLCRRLRSWVAVHNSHLCGRVVYWLPPRLTMSQIHSYGIFAFYHWLLVCQKKTLWTKATPS